MNPGRAPRWSSVHCPRGVPAMKVTPLQASNLKQEDNLRPKKMGNTVNDTRKRRSVRVFFFLLAADNLVLIRLRVFGPSESREPRPNPSNEGNDDDTQPGNTPARLSPQRLGFQGTWGRLGGAAHGLSRQKLVPITQQRNAQWRLPVPTTQVTRG
jgi:hypothetical protein